MNVLGHTTHHLKSEFHNFGREDVFIVDGTPLSLFAKAFMFKTRDSGKEHRKNVLYDDIAVEGFQILNLSPNVTQHFTDLLVDFWLSQIRYGAEHNSKRLGRN